MRRYIASILSRTLGGTQHAVATTHTTHRSQFSFRHLSITAALAGFLGLRCAELDSEIYARFLPNDPPPPPHETLQHDVVLYQYEYQPQSQRIRVYLDYYDIPYKVVEVNSFSKKEIKWSHHQQVPILMLNGQQLNDTSAIFDKLAHKINSKESADPTTDYEEAKWQRWVENYFFHILFHNVLRSVFEAFEFVQYCTSNSNFRFIQKFTVKYHLAPTGYLVYKALAENPYKNKERAALYEAVETWVDALNGRDFLGGSKPNLADLDLFVVLRFVRNLRCGKDIMEHTRIGEWYARMESAVGESSQIKD